VKRIILTSSFSAMLGGGWKVGETNYDERDFAKIEET